MRLLSFALQFVSTRRERVLIGLLLGYRFHRAMHAFCQRRNLLVQSRLIRIHRCHAACQHHAQPPAQLLAHCGKTLSLGCLPLQAVHLPGHFFKDVVHARQVLLGAFQAQLCQPLLVLESRNSRCFFNDGAALVWLRAQQLPNAFLTDNCVALRPQAGAHKDVLNITQAAELAIQQIFAFAGAKQPPRNDHFAFSGRRVKLASPDLQQHPLRGGRLLDWICALGSLCRRCTLVRFFLYHLSRLLVGDDLLGLGGALLPYFFLVPIHRSVGIDHHLWLNGNRSLVRLGIDHCQRDFGHSQRLSVARAGKDEVLHMPAAQCLCALLAQHPSDPVEDVRLATPVRPHHNGDSRSGYG